MRSIRAKIIFVALLSCAILAAIIGTSSVLTIIDTNNQKTKDLEITLRGNFDRLIKLEVETAISLLQEVYKKSEKGEMTLEEAKKQGAELLRNLRYDKDGYFWADTKEGLNIVLLGRETEGTNRLEALDVKGNAYMKDIIASGMKEGGGYSDYWFPKKESTEALPKRAYSLEFKPFGWIVGTGNYTDDIDTLIANEKAAYHAHMVKNIITILALTLVSMAFAAALALFLGIRISHPIMRVIKLLNQTANYDLTYDESFEKLLKNRDETGMMARSLFDMRKTLREMVRIIMGISESLSVKSKDLAYSTEENTKTITQVVLTINEIAQSNSTQAESIHETNQTIFNVVNTIDEVSSATVEGAENAVKSLDAVKDGQKAVDLQVEKMKENIAISDNVGTSIQELNEGVNKIGNIVNVITSIAAQTNLLALNAAIEAARAGEAGKGFAVVSEEIRKLAEGSSSAAKEITAIIKETTDKTQKAVKSVNQAAGIVKEQEEALDNTKDAFDKIKVSVEEIVQKSKYSASVLEEINSMAKTIASKSQEMESAVEETAASTEEISASGEEQLASIELTASACQDLAQYAEKLQQQIVKFIC